jgi:hypothetical protein
VEVGYAVPERFNVQLPRLECLVDCCSHLGHFREVVVTVAGVEIEDLLDALPGHEEHTSPEVLVGCQSDVAGFKPSNEPGIGALLGGCIVGANGAICHWSSMTTVLQSAPRSELCPSGPVTASGEVKLAVARLPVPHPDGDV